jgi:ABC-type bacteriocin/lantibiotic exporter with double-glycine peptidase domain
VSTSKVNGLDRENARTGLTAVLTALFSVKRLFIRSIVVALTVGVVAAMIQVSQKWFIATPELSTITKYTVVSGLQVFLSMLFYAQRHTLAAAMGRHLTKQLVTKIFALSKAQLESIGHRFGKLHSSVFTNLVQGFGSNLPGIVNNCSIVVFHMISLTITFGWKYLVISLIGVGLLCGLGTFVLEKNRQRNAIVKELDVSTNQHLNSLTDQLQDIQETGNSKAKSELITEVLDELVAFNKHEEWPRTKLDAIHRVVPTFICTYGILWLAIYEHRSPAELVMIVGSIFNIMVVANAGLLLIFEVAHLEGDLTQVGAVINNPPAPDGHIEIGCIEELSLAVNRVELPGARVLFSQGLFPDHPKKELHIKTGEFVCLHGPSGCGKTTILRIMSRQYEQQITSAEQPRWFGSYRFISDGGLVTDVSKIRKKSFWTIVFTATQKASWVDGIRKGKKSHWKPGTVEENIGLHLDNEGFDLKLSPWERETFIREAARVAELSPAQFGQSVQTLSGGEAVRAMLARCASGVLVATYLEFPCVLILDETFSQLDEETAIKVLANLLELNRLYGVTIISSIHNKNLIPSDATVYVFGEAGRGIVAWGKGSEMLNN